MDYPTLAEILALTPDGLSLDHAEIAVSHDRATVSSTAQVLGRPGFVSLVITPGADGLQSSVAAGLSNMTIAEMAALGWVPGAVDLARLPGVTFPAAQISAGTAADRVRVTAPMPTGELLASPPFALASPELDLGLVVVGEHIFPESAAVTARAGADALPVSLALPTTFSGWVLSLGADASRSFSDASGLDAFMGVGVSGLLPPGLPLGLQLTALTCEFSTSDASLLAASATVATTESWSIIAGVLALDSVSLRLHAEHYPSLVEADPGWVYQGQLSASLSVFDVPVSIDAELGTAVLSLTAEPNLTFPGIGAAAGQATALLGGSDFSSALPPALANLASVSVDLLTLEVDARARRLLAAGLTVSKPADLDWSFPLLPGFAVVDARIAIDVRSPLDAAERSFGAEASLVGRIGEAELGFSVTRAVGAPDCALSLVSSGGVTLPDLFGLVGFDQAAFSAALPASLSIVSDFGLNALDIDYDLSADRPTRIDLSLALGDTWRIIPDHLEVGALDISLSIRSPTELPEDRIIDAQLSGLVQIGSVEFAASAATRPGGGGWLLRAEMESGAAPALTDIGAGLLPSGIALPDQFPQVTLDAASIAVATDTLAMQAAFATSVHWQPTVLGRPGDMAALSLALDVQPADEAGQRPYELTVAGRLALDPLPTLSAVCRTGSGLTDTELLAVLTPADLQQLSLDAVATGFAGAGAALGSAPAPQDFSAPAFTSAAFYANVTTPSLVLFGQAERLGTAAFVVCRRPDAPPGGDSLSRYGAALILSTAPGFTFAQILPDGSALQPALAAIDTVIEIEEASLVLSSFELPASAANPFTAMNRLAAAAGSLPTPIPVPAPPPSIALKAGLNLSAKLKLSTGAIWQGLKYIIDTRADSPVMLSAWIDPHNPGSSRFEASLGAFTILQTLTFERVDLVYLPNVASPPPSADGTSQPPAAAPSLTLSCAGSLSIPTFASAARAGDPDEAASTLLSFQGDLAVTATGATATFGTQGTLLRRPLGIPGITINQVGIALNYAFTTDSSGASVRTLTRMAATGSITLGTVLDLEASVLFVAGVPQIVMIELGKPVTINDIFNEFVGTDAFGGLPTLRFDTGQVYFAPADVAPIADQPAYRQGLHVAATFSLLGADFVAALDLVPGDGVTGTAATAHPIDFGFLKITGAAGGETGPGVIVRALHSTGVKQFGVQFGFKLFGLSFVNGLMAYQTAGDSGGEAAYLGSIAYSGSTPFGDNPSITVRWTQSRGFEVLNWPGNLPIADLTRIFETASADSPCGALTALGLGDNFVQGRCKTDIEVTAGTPQHKDDGTTSPVAHVAINLRYLISVPNPTGGDRIVLNAGVTPIEIELDIPAPENADVDTLLNAAVHAAADLVAGAVRAVLNDPVAMAAFAGALAIKTLTNEAINNLICRDIDEPNLKEEYEERHKGDNEGNEGDEADKQLDEANSNAAAAEAASTVEGAMSAAMNVVVAAAAIGGFFASLLSAIVHLFGGKTEEEKRADRMRDAAAAAQQRADDAVRSHLAISGLTIGYDDRHRCTARWDALAGDVRYAITLNAGGRTLRIGGDGFSLGQSGNSASFEDDAIGPGVQLSLTVAASIRSGDEFTGRVWTGAPGVLSYTIDDFGPHALLVEQVEGAVEASWAPGPHAATGWTVTVTVPSDGSVAPVNASVPATANRWRTTALAPGRTYAVLVAPTGASYPDLPAATNIAVTGLGAPTGIAGVYDAEAETLTVQWAATSGQASGRVQLRAQPMFDRTVGATDTSLAVDHAASLVPGSMRVGAVGTATDGPIPVDWSAWTDFAPAVPAAPEISAFVFRPPLLLADWAVVAGASGYEAKVSDSATPAAVSAGTVEPRAGGFRASFAGPFAAGATMTVQVRSSTEMAVGRWSASDAAAARLTLVDIPSPASFSAVNGDSAVHLAWEAVASASDGYEVVVADASGLPLDPQPAQTPTSPGSSCAVDLDGAALEDGVSYTISLRTRAGRCFSPATELVLVRAPEHAGAFVALHNTLAASPEGGDAAPQRLTATILDGPGPVTVAIDAGATAALGSARIVRAEVLRVFPRPDALVQLLKAGLFVTRKGGRLTLGWDDLIAGRVPDGISVAIGRGYRTPQGDVWADGPIGDMVRALADAPQMAGPQGAPALANALLDVYPDIGVSALAAALAFGNSPQVVAGGLAGVAGRLSASPAARLAALFAPFDTGQFRRSPLELIGVTGGGALTAAAIVEMVRNAYSSRLDDDTAVVLAAYALADGGFGQADAVAALTGALADANRAEGAAGRPYGTPGERLAGLVLILARLGFDPRRAVEAASPLDPDLSAPDLATALARAYPPPVDLFVWLRLLKAHSANMEAAMTALMPALTAPVEGSALAAALKAVVPSPSAVTGLTGAIADGATPAAAAKAVRDAYQPTTLQLAALLSDTLAIADPAVLGRTLAEAGAPPDEAAAALAEFFPWLSAEARIALCRTEG